MKIPLSWLKDFVDIRISIEELAYLLTMAGLEVEEIRYVGLPMPSGRIEGRPGGHSRVETKISGIEWEADKIVVGAVLEVMPHPNADRLVLCRLNDGEKEHIVLTGASNLFPFKSLGPLAQPLKVAYAREGARIFDGHQTGQVLMTLKRAKIRGVESYSMACSEKELGISEDHEGVIILDPDAPTGMSLVEYMGDAVLDIALLPNIARDACVLGVAREVSALTGEPLRPPDFSVSATGKPIHGRVMIEILNPELNPRFVLGLIEGIEICPSPYEIQRRLRLAGMRPINNIVDATNYAMLEVGEPLHAFDYDVLVQRADGKPPRIITRTAKPGERLVTLDGVERELDDFTVLVCDEAGPLSIAGVMGGAESEVGSTTRNVLLEGAAWNFTNIRRTLLAQRMISEAAYRFSRGVHPALADQGVRRALELMRLWSSGTVAQGLVDNYPLPPVDPVIEFTTMDVKRWLGIELQPPEIAAILKRLEFSVTVEGETLRAQTPGHRLDIGEGIVGVADLMEEIARIYGYQRIPETRMADEIPPQQKNPDFETEEVLRDILVNLGLQEVITHRLTAPEKERRRFLDAGLNAAMDSAPGGRIYLWLENPIASDRTVLRKDILAGLLEVAERNARLTDRMAFFEIGKVYLPIAGQTLPDEPRRIGILLSGPRSLAGWQNSDRTSIDFFDLKGIVEALFTRLHLAGIVFKPGTDSSFHPGKCADVAVRDQTIGVIGELHPLIKERYDLPEYPVLLAEVDLDAIQPLLPERYELLGIPIYPPVLEDLSFVVPEEIPAQRVLELIRESSGDAVANVRLFDVYRGGQAGPGKKSLAFNLTYQAPDRTLTDGEVAAIRNRIVSALDKAIGAQLRRG